MINQALTRELISRAQFDQVIEFFDNWLQVYNVAAFVLSVVVICILAWLVFCEATAPKTNKKIPSYHQARAKRRLLRTEP